MTRESQAPTKYQIYRGQDGNLVVTPTGIIMQRRLKNLLRGQMWQPDKIITYSDINAMECRLDDSGRGRLSCQLGTGQQHHVHFDRGDEAAFNRACSTIELRVASRQKLDEQVGLLAEDHRQGRLTLGDYEAAKAKLLQEHANG